MIKKNEVQAYFPHAGDSAVIRRDVQRFLRGIHSVCPEVQAARIQWRILRNRNWNSTWRRFFSPQKVGRALIVAPPWAKLGRLHGRHLITIEPGMAFGTGTHTTTRGCMEFIETVHRALEGEEFTALDVGTGSGILAIALAKLGAARVWALDNDPVALKVARENFHLNAVAGRVFLYRSNLSAVRRSFSVVLANLTAESILNLAAPLAARVGAKGFLVLSGIMRPQGEQVLRRFRSNGFRLIQRKDEKEWVTLLLKRR